MSSLPSPIHRPQHGPICRAMAENLGPPVPVPQSPLLPARVEQPPVLAGLAGLPVVVGAAAVVQGLRRALRGCECGSSAGVGGGELGGNLASASSGEQQQVGAKHTGEHASCGAVAQRCLFAQWGRT